VAKDVDDEAIMDVATVDDEALLEDKWMSLKSEATSFFATEWIPSDDDDGVNNDDAIKEGLIPSIYALSSSLLPLPSLSPLPSIRLPPSLPPPPPLPRLLRRSLASPGSRVIRDAKSRSTKRAEKDPK